MCGVAGYVAFNAEIDQQVLLKMVQTLIHRGPDNFGINTYSSRDASVGFAQARLSIIDLSVSANLPMTFLHLHLVYNGEVYNYKEIKHELISLGHIFITDSDSEVILHSYYQWGKQSVSKFIGMFVIVIYDTKKEELVIIRDRAGIKPFFYYYNNGVFIFGSEIKALLQHNNFSREIDFSSLSLYFELGYIPAPYSIFRDCHKIEPGHILILNLKDRTIKNDIYWDVDTFYKKQKLSISYNDAKSQLVEIMKSAFNYRLVADVPVGVFQSGGYDSTAVTAILQRDKTERLNTFTIGFEEGNNEAPFAKEIAKFLGTNHTEFYCTTREAQEIIPTLPYYFDEPFADSSAIPTMLVSRLARKSVTVSLSADAGDELFAGYENYKQLDSRLRLLRKTPGVFIGPISLLSGKIASLLPSQNVILKHKFKGLATSLSQNEKLTAINLAWNSSRLPSYYMNSLFKNKIDSYPVMLSDGITDFDNGLETAMAFDYRMYLQNDILTKVDRATMSASLEGREPFLDHRLIEFVAQLPLQYKFENNSGKRILKDIVHDVIPERLVGRTKTGFTLPIYSWLLGDLKFLLDEFLSEKALNNTGILNSQFVERQVRLFIEGNLHYKTLIWRLLMFQMWYKKWLG
jgi:asparagine synthase (glutamine-hydrolysing)